MPKIVKYLAIAAAVLLALLLAAVAIIAATFDPNDYKPLLIRMVQEKKQRTLVIPGDIRLNFFPRLAIGLGRVSISERNGSAEFASVESAKLSLALFPLLSKQLVIDKIDITGMRANVRRSRDGGTNVDDLLAKEEAGGQAIRFDIDGIRMVDAHIVYDDRQEARRFEIAHLNLDTGRIADGVPSKLQLTADVKADKPAVNARVAFKTGFTLNLQQKHYVFKGADAQIHGAAADFTGLVLTAAGNADLRPDAKRFTLDGVKFGMSGKRAAQAIELKFDLPELAITDARVSGGKLNGEVRLAEGGRSITAVLTAPSFEGSPQAFRLPSLVLDAALKQAGLDVKAKISGALSGNIDQLRFASPQLVLALSGKQDDKAISGSLTTPLSADLKTGAVDLSRIAAGFMLPNPGGGMLAWKASGNATLNLNRKTAAAVVKGTFDDSAFDARLGLAQFAPPAYTFDIGVDRLDLDRYRSKPAAAGSKSTAPEKPIDLSALRDLRASGNIRIGALKAANIKASNVRFHMRAAGGRLDIDPFAASLYGGSAAGVLSVALGNPGKGGAAYAMRQNLSGINVGSLLKDALGKDPIEGRGDVRLDVTASGLRFDQIRKSLNGSARLELHDGSVRGVNIAQAVRSAKTKIGAIRGDAPAQTGNAAAGEKTDFSELTGSFRIRNGVAHNDDLNIKSPLMRVGGSGDIDLGNERIDYLARATVVSTLQGQGGRELEALKGVTIPVRLSGPFGAIGWRIDFAGIASGLAKQKIDERKEEVKSKAREAIDEQKAKAQEQIKEKLKGLLGK